MIKKLKSVVLVFFFLFMGIRVNAATCDYKTMAELNKNASKITAAYEVKRTNNKESFDITVHNIIEELYVTVVPTSKTIEEIETFQISHDMTQNGTYTFHVDNISDVIEYQFIVRTTKENCIEDIYTFYLTKPKKNKFYEKEICKYSEVVDYYYCQEWVETEFSIADVDIEEKIKKERENKRKNVTTKCLSCEAETKAIREKEKKNLIKIILIIALGVGIIIDGISIVLLMKRARRANIWE